MNNHDIHLFFLLYLIASVFVTFVVIFVLKFHKLKKQIILESLAATNASLSAPNEEAQTAAQPSTSGNLWQGHATNVVVVGEHSSENTDTSGRNSADDVGNIIANSSSAQSGNESAHRGEMIVNQLKMLIIPEVLLMNKVNQNHWPQMQHHVHQMKRC